MADTMRITDGTTTIDFSPQDGYIKPNRFDAPQHEAISGKAYVYTFFKKGRWELPLDFISSNDAGTINGWHENKAQLTFYDDLINKPSTSYTVRIWNNESPLDNFRLASWEDKFNGVLILRAI